MKEIKGMRWYTTKVHFRAHWFFNECSNNFPNNEAWRLHLKYERISSFCRWKCNLHFEAIRIASMVLACEKWVKIFSCAVLKKFHFLHFVFTEPLFVPKKVITARITISGYLDGILLKKIWKIRKISCFVQPIRTIILLGECLDHRKYKKFFGLDFVYTGYPKRSDSISQPQKDYENIHM